MSKRVMIQTDITDWAEETLREEPDLQDKDAAVETQMGRRLSPQKMGRMIVAGRELGIAPDDLVPPTKVLIQTGATRKWAEVLRREKVSVETEDGKTVTVRRLVGPVADAEDGSDEPWIDCLGPEAVARAEAYLMDRIPRHVQSRLAIVKANKGDVRAVLEKLKAELDKVADSLA